MVLLQYASEIRRSTLNYTYSVKILTSAYGRTFVAHMSTIVSNYCAKSTVTSLKALHAAKCITNYAVLINGEYMMFYEIRWKINKISQEKNTKGNKPINSYFVLK